MSDLQFRGVSDCGEKGERGERGKRGRHGHRGPQGRDGHDGQAGPAGPSGRDGREGISGRAGSAGPVGPAGQVGPRGPAGTSEPSGLLKFSGAVGLSLEGSFETFLADVGNGVLLAEGPGYPLAVKRSLRNLATNLLFSGGPAVKSATVVIELLKNGSPVAGFAITYNVGGGETGVKTISVGPTAYAIGETFDMRVTTSGFGTGRFSLSMSATVGTEGV